MLFELLSAVFSLRSVRLEFETVSNRMACPQEYFQKAKLIPVEKQATWINFLQTACQHR